MQYLKAPLISTSHQKSAAQQHQIRHPFELEAENVLRKLRVGADRVVDDRLRQVERDVKKRKRGEGQHQRDQLLLPAVLDNKAIDRRFESRTGAALRLGRLRLRSGASAAGGTSREPALVGRRGDCRHRFHHACVPPPKQSSSRTPDGRMPYCDRRARMRRRLCVTDRRDHKRILIYSHDTFGLGHLRRCRAIAHSLVDADTSLSVLILSGSPIIGSFDFRSRVDFVRMPGVIKLRNGEYVSLSLHIDIEETLAMRSSIIRHTAEIFDPDMLIVDKEPLGLRGEVRPTLDLLQARGTPLVLGLRDVMDDPSALESEWERKNAVPALSELLRRDLGLWPAADLRPAGRLELPASVRRRMVYTGYLRRSVPPPRARRSSTICRTEQFLLVTAGRRRRRRRADRLGARAPMSTTRQPAAGAARVRPVHAARAPGRVRRARRATAEGARR